MIKSLPFCQISPWGKKTILQFFLSSRDCLCEASRPEEWDAVFLEHPAGVAEHKKEWHRLWEIYESDKYTLFYAPQNSFPCAP